MSFFRYSIFLLITAIVFLHPVHAQKKLLSKANKKFKTGHYHTAINIYKEILPKIDDKSEIYYQIAESYRLSNSLFLAKEYYDNSIKTMGKDLPVLTYYYYGFSLKMNGLYKEAGLVFREFLKKEIDEEHQDEVTRAREEILLLDKIENLFDKNEQVEVKNYTPLNTKEDDYSPLFLAPDRLYISSTSHLKGSIFEMTGNGFSNLFYVDFTPDDIFSVEKKEIIPLSREINIPHVNEGTMAFFNRGKSMIFARGNTKKNNKEVNLYIAHLKSGKWGSIEMLSFNSLEDWDSSPAFSSNGRYLYFASSRAGGYGNIDIYRVLKNRDGTWGEVQNMGSTINTSGNDLFPYVSADKKFYYASDGREGFGGLDLYVAERKNNKTVVKNMGEKFNSSFDDFSISFVTDSTGLFTSNRAGGLGDDDIYYFYIKKPEVKEKNNYVLNFQVSAQSNKNPLEGVELKIIPSQKDTVVFHSSKSGIVKYPIDIFQEYTIVASKPDYITKKLEFVSKDFIAFSKNNETDSIVDVKIILEEIVIGKVFEFTDPATSAPPQEEKTEETPPSTSPTSKEQELEPSKNTVVVSSTPKEEKAPPTSPTPKEQELEPSKNTVVSSTPQGDAEPVFIESISSFDEVYYDYDKFNIKEEAKPALDKLLAFLVDNPSIIVEINSFTDERGADMYNLILSQKRSKSVVNYLISKGIEKSRLKARGYGEFFLKKKNAETETEHALNRRTALKIIGRN